MEYLHRGSHILSFHANKCISAYILHYIVSQLQIASLAMASSPPPPLWSYQNTLVSLLSFLDGHKYHKDMVFAEDRLAAISADDILRWMNFKTFGTPFPDPDANPTGCHLSTILFWKKSISFIPNKHHLWESLLCRGNPNKIKGDP
jgi:hypothetical protein